MRNLNLVVAALTIVNSACVMAQQNIQQGERQEQPHTARIDVTSIRRINVGGAVLKTAPLCVNERELLAPFIDDRNQGARALYASLSQTDVKHLPESFDPAKSFQINVFKGATIKLCIGEARAFIDNEEYKLAAAPCIINNKIFLPVLSLAPLLDATMHMDVNNTLLLVRRG